MTRQSRIVSLALILLTCGGLKAQNVVLGAEDFVTPPKEISDVLLSDAMHNRESYSNLGPDSEHLLIAKSMGMPPLALVGRPYVNLGETSIDHIANRSRSLSMGSTVGYDLVSWKTGDRVSVQVPDGITVSGAQWSPCGKFVAFLGHHAEATRLYTAEVKSGEAHLATERSLNACLTSSIAWSGDSTRLIAALIPEDRGPMPTRNPVAREPSVWISHEGETPTRTYRFLLKTPYDKQLLEYLSTSQLASIDVSSGEVTPIGNPGMITKFDASPDASYFRVTTMQKPFSYFVPRSQFGTREETWDSQGKALNTMSERKFRDLQKRNPPATRQGGGGRGSSGSQPQTGAASGKRSLSWRPDGQGMSFLQREPEPKKEEKKDDAKKDDAKKDDAKKDDAKKDDVKKDDVKKDDVKKTRKDRVMQWLPPFDEKSVQVVWASDDSISSVRYSADCKTLYVTTTKDGGSQTFAVKIEEPGKKLKISERKASKGAKAPTPRRGGRGNRGGSSRGLMTTRGPNGGSIVRTSSDGKHVYTSGSEKLKEGEAGTPRPTIDRIEVGTGKKERVWTGAKDANEALQAVLDADLGSIAISRQSATEVPNSWIRDTTANTQRQATHNADPAPSVTAAERLRFQVTRVDGFKFWVNVTIPRDHGEKLPALFWFYPREFTSQKKYDDRVRKPDPHRFPSVRTRSMQMFTMLGYVVVEPDCPIVGAEGRPNDNYVADIRNSLWAVIDDLDKKGIIDRDRLALGGHSYGAFSTANAMVHTPFFKAGIAGDGNYNRTLTPMSFQSERRNIWDARETYLAMSPLLWANQFNGALLMYHGMDDANSGTFPIHAPRMFQVLNGLGKPAALYRYPYEGHGPKAKETILDLWARWAEWLDIWVKNPERGKNLHKAAKPRQAIETNGK